MKTDGLKTILRSLSYTAVSVLLCVWMARFARLLSQSSKASRRSSILATLTLVVALIGTNEALAATDTFNASGTWTAPAGVTSATVEAWGGGGGGGSASGNPSKGGGGAGGQYSIKVITVTPGNNYAVVVGGGGAAATVGSDSTFATNVVVAKGGAAGASATTNSGAGAAGAGSTTGGVGDTVRAGGNGSAGTISATPDCGAGGAGGGGAGSTGAGGNASGNTAGTGTATGGGNGGAGIATSSAGNAGSALGGGGGGACAESNTDRTGGAGGVGRVTVTYTIPPLVSSINRASTNPAYADDTVTWTVTFTQSVTGVNSSDFQLVMGGGASGHSITSVTGSGTTWTVTVSGGAAAGTLGLNLVDDDTIVNGGVPLGATGTGNGDFTGQVYTLNAPFCAAPSNVPAGVTVNCVCDRFGRASLNPSTIYGSNWIVSKSDSTAIVPYINATSGLLRLTENTGNNAKAATVPGIFPAAGNYISVEFVHYAYGGSGADGIAVTLSDYSVTAVPGAFGGSLGYAPKDAAACGVAGGCPGFAGGWIGVALDEFGNYQNPTEGRTGGPGSRPDSVGVRGSGAGLTGYNWMAGTTALTPGIDNTGSATPAPGYKYQVIVDARNDPTSTAVAVNRDTGAGYASLINIPNVYTAAAAQGFTQAAVPVNWQISFTASTGGSTNIHEIGGLKVCAQSVAPPSGGTASGFNAIDEAYGTPPSGPAVQSFLNGHIYMKVMNKPFKLNVAPLNNSQIVTTYVGSVTVKLVDNSDGACALDNTQPNYCSATCKAKTAVTGGTSAAMSYALADAGKKQTADFTLNTAYKNLVAIITDGTTTACSTDAFSVRPQSVATVTSANAASTLTAANTTTTGSPALRAGADQFSITATTTGVAGNASGYTGQLKVTGPTGNTGIAALSPATVAGVVSPTTLPAATSGTGSSTTRGDTFTYSEVGGFTLLGYALDTSVTSPRGVYDGVWSATECASQTVAYCDTLRNVTWMGVDSITSKGDCVQDSFSNTKDANGKYGCLFGNLSSVSFGRFTPAYFDVTRTHGCSSSSAFTYAGVIPTPAGQPFSVTVTAKNSATNTTRNYHSGASTYAKNTTISNAGTPTGFDGTTNVLTAAAGALGFTNGVATTNTINYSFATKETAATTLTLRAVDTDTVSSASMPPPGEPTAEMRSGRVSIQNVFGSELADLPMPMHMQYYLNASNGWVLNGADDCTAVTLAFPTFYSNLASGETCVQDIGSPGRSGSSPVTCAAAGPVAEQFREGGIAGFNGNFNLYLKAPGAGNNGSVDVTTNLSATPWLRVDSDGDGSVDDDPLARATFGRFTGNTHHIYLRERY